MLWINKEVEAEQVRIESPDITAAVVRLPDRLDPGCIGLRTRGRSAGSSGDMRLSAQRGGGCQDEVQAPWLRWSMVGDFNRHDQLWGGDDVALERQGEADQIIDLMSDLSLSSLLRRGTKTWQQ